MRKFWPSVAVALLAICAFTLSARADQNPAPTNVGLYNFSTFTATTSSSKIINRNTARAFFLVQNTGATNVVLKPGAVQSGTEGIVLVPGAAWMPVPPPVDAFWAVSASSTDVLTIIEGAK